METTGSDVERGARPTGEYQGEASAQGRAERGIEHSFARDAGSGKARTGTSDLTYNLISIVHHALEGADAYDTYATDAERGGDRELARFFRDVQEQNRRRAERAKDLLRERFAETGRSQTSARASDSSARSGEGATGDRDLRSGIRSDELRSDELRSDELRSESRAPRAQV